MSAEKSNNQDIALSEITTYLERGGLTTVETASCWWYNAYRGQKRILYSFPPHRLVEPAPDEIASVFSAVPSALAVRYVSPQGAPGRQSFQWVCRPPYTLESLSANNRSKVRRGLERCEVRAVTWSELKASAWTAHRDTMRRHGAGKVDSLGFDEHLGECSAYEAWGAFAGGTLAAFLITLAVENWAHLLVNRSSDAHLKLYPNNALVFDVVRQLLERPHITAISYGWEPLTSRSGLTPFKQSLGFRMEPVQQRVVLRPWLAGLAKEPASSIIAKLASWGPHRFRAQLSGLWDIVRSS